MLAGWLLGCGLDHFGKCGGIADGHLSQHLAVEANVSLLQAVGQLAVAEAALAGCCVNASNPQATEITLATAAIAVRIPQRLHNLLVCGAEELGVRADVAFSQLEDLFASFAGDVTPFYSRHDGWKLDELNQQKLGRFRLLRSSHSGLSRKAFAT